MNNFDGLVFSRHSACYISGVPPEQISKSRPEVMAELNAIFADYNYSPSSLFGELISQISDLFNQVDPMGIIEKGDASQDDEYLPEADMVIWLHASKNLNNRTFWAIWEYQFADLNPYADENDESLDNLYNKVLDSLDSR